MNTVGVAVVTDATSVVVSPKVEVEVVLTPSRRVDGRIERQPADVGVPLVVASGPGQFRGERREEVVDGPR